MKNYLSAFLLLVSFIGYSQEPTPDVSQGVEKCIFGFQVGIAGGWFTNEIRLSNTVALRSELGLDFGFSVGENQERTVALIPSLRLEPRWYYDIEKRASNGKNIDDNSANFVAVNLTYNPDWFIISNRDSNVLSSLGIIPKWGIKRNIGRHFNYEFGAGAGYVFYFEEFEGDNGTIGIDLHARIGYRF